MVREDCATHYLRQPRLVIVTASNAAMPNIEAAEKESAARLVGSKASASHRLRSREDSSRPSCHETASLRDPSDITACFAEDCPGECSS